MFEKFTDKARGVLRKANDSAIKMNHNYVSVDHLLIGILFDQTNVASRWISDSGIKASDLLSIIYGQFVKNEGPPSSGKLPFTPKSNLVCSSANEIAKERGDCYVGTEHIILAILRQKEGIAYDALILNGLNEESFTKYLPVPFERLSNLPCTKDMTFEEQSNFREPKNPELTISEISKVLLRFLAKESSATETVILMRKLL
jgi:ATP-dependent Clp protease ATP-binding subunit ClpA